MRWQGAPDTDELLFDQAEASHIPTPPDFEAKDLSLVFVDDCLDMRVGNRASKRRRTVSGYKTEAASSQDQTLAAGKQQASKHSSLRELAPGPIPSSWTVRRRPGKQPAGSAADIRLVYQAPSGETFRTYAKARAFWLSQGQRAKRTSRSQARADDDAFISQLPAGWTMQRKDETPAVYLAPSGQQYPSLQAAQAYCRHANIPLPIAAMAPSSSLLSVPSLHASLQKLAEGKLKGLTAKMQQALMRARQVRSLGRRRGAMK